MKNFETTLVSEDTSILSTLRCIDESAIEIALVVDSNKRLLGTVTDGDIRRAILREVPLSAKICGIMNPKPITAFLDTPDDELLFLMLRRSIKHLPILNHDRQIVDLRLLKEIVGKKRRDNMAVIMAGGLGTRLGELTQNTPKPLLPVGNRPLLGTIVNQLRQHGIWDIRVAVNFKSEQIKEYLGDGAAFDAKIAYLEEPKRLGTAGPLSLLTQPPTAPFLVMNGDILTTVNFSSLFDYHQASGKSMTVCIREFKFQVPYGVIKVLGNDLASIEEKPCQNFYINTGIYVLDPSLLNELKPGEYLDMPTLISRARNLGPGVGCFPLSDYWLDIGQLEDYRRAQGEFAVKFEA